MKLIKKKIHLVLLLFSFMYCIPVMAEDYNSYIQKGDEYYNQFDNLRALDEYKKIYELAPDSFDALMKLTRAYNDVGEDIRGIKFNPETESHSKEVKEYFNEAVKYAQLLYLKFPDRAESYFYLAVTYGNLALFKGGKEKVRIARDVETNCQKAIELDPQFIPAYIALGVYYREVANLSWVHKAFAKMLFGELAKGTNKDSEKTLLKALALNPQIIHTHFELAKTYYAMDEEDKASEQLREILPLSILDHEDKEIKAEAVKQLHRFEKDKTVLPVPTPFEYLK
jgi:tetratricopeptide (TPR) repeat protein